MPTEVNSDNHELPRGLPPVTPPSARFIGQLFLIPGLIVAVLLAIYLGCGGLTGWVSRSAFTAESFLERLDSENPDVRWRAAHELAQVLERPESIALASDAKFALDLAECLHKALDKLQQAEQATQLEIQKAEKAAKEKKKELSEQDRKAFWHKLQQQRDHVLFLTGCMGRFVVPATAPLLCEMAVTDTGPEVKGLTQRRRVALWALTNLGSNYQRRYLGVKPQPDDRVLTQDQKDEIIAHLKQEAAKDERRALWAKQTLDQLENKPSPTSVDAVLERCAGSDDPDFRNRVAMVLNFWDGARVEPTLLRLARDDGRGVTIKIDDE